MAAKSEIKESLSDTGYFEKVFKEHFNPLTYYAIKLVKDQDSAMDIVHNVFIKLWEMRESISLEKGLKSYLYTAVHNRCLNFIRDKAKFVKEDSSDLSFMAELSSEDYPEIETTETESRINDAINKLPEKCRQVFTLNRFEEKKYSEIAHILKISIKTVEAQMSKALKILREELKDYLVLLLWLTTKIFW